MKRIVLALLATALCQADSLSQARLAMNRGELVNAEQILTTALDELQAKYGPNAPALDATLDMLVQVYQREKRFPEALLTQQRRLEIWTAAVGENAVIVARVLQQTASTERQAGNLPAAEQDSRRALAIMTAAYVDQPPSAQAAVDLADILQAENRSSDAGQMLALAEKTYETALGPDSILVARLKKIAPKTAVYQAGGSVVPPRLQSKVEPQYAEEARKHKLQGSILLSLVVDASGTPTQIVVLRPLGMGLDEKAVEAISQWKFTPGQKNGLAVPVLSQIEMTFHIL